MNIAEKATTPKPASPTKDGPSKGQHHGKLLAKIFSEIDGLGNDLGGVEKPRGTKEMPARSCKDIYLEYPTMPDG